MFSSLPESFRFLVLAGAFAATFAATFGFLTAFDPRGRPGRCFSATIGDVGGLALAEGSWVTGGVGGSCSTNGGSCWLAAP
ncbi:hypothetical protein B0H14DRAFT_2778143 [Mycena olivaceomarginata]|nr:hypothetical protein B0H14DRAFT_2778143 [Mycena olivaceomarginata]